MLAQYRVHIVLEFDRLANQPREHAGHLQRVGDREADKCETRMLIQFGGSDSSGSPVLVKLRNILSECEAIDTFS